MTLILMLWVLSECSLSYLRVLSDWSLSTLWVLSVCSVIALWVLSECFLTYCWHGNWLLTDWLLKDLSQKVDEFQLCNGRTDGRTHIVTPWAPVGAKNYMQQHNRRHGKTFSFRNYHEGRLSYYNFNVAWWRKYVGDSEVWTFQVAVNFLFSDGQTHEVFIVTSYFSGWAGQVPLPVCFLHRGGAGCGPQCPGPLPGRGPQVLTLWPWPE